MGVIENDWMYAVVIGFVAAIGVCVISLITSFIVLLRIASITSCIECFVDQADQLTSRLNRQ